MHVLHLSATGALGGAERCLLDILTSVRQASPDWRLSVVTGADGALVSAVKALDAGAKVVPYGEALARLGEAGRSSAWFGAAALAGRLAWSAGPAMQYVIALGGLIDELRPDVIHTHGLKMHILAAWAAGSGRVARHRPRVVWHVHDYLGTRPATARFLRWSVRSCDAIVTNSSSVAADVHETLHPSIPVVAVHNAVDLQRFSPSGDRLDLDRLAGMPPAPSGTVRVGLIGTFGRWKGHRTFLDAIARLDSAAPVRALRDRRRAVSNGGQSVQTRGTARARRGERTRWPRRIHRLRRCRRRSHPRARHRGARQHGPGTVRAGNRGSDGVRAASHRERRGRRQGDLHAWR